MCWAVFVQVAFKNNTDLVSSVTSQESVLSLSAGSDLPQTLGQPGDPLE